MLFSFEHQPRALRPGVRCSAPPKERESIRRRHWEGKKIGKEREEESERGGSTTVGA